MSSKIYLSIASGTFIAAPFLFPALFPLAWFAFIPLFMALRGSRNLSEVIVPGLVMGGVGSLLGFYWLPYTIRVFGGFPYGISWLIFIVYSLFAAFPFALFAFLVNRFGFGPLHLFPALLWITVEFWFPHLFPWHLANTQTQFLALIQSADLVGPYGASFLVMWLNATIYRRLFPRKGEARAAFVPGTVLGGLIIAALVYGHWKLSEVSAEMATAPRLSLAAVQGNIGVDTKWDPEQVKNNLKAYVDLTKKAQGVRLVIWPETAAEDWVPEGIKQLPPELIGPSDAFFIFGARSFRGGLGAADFQAFNSAFLADNAGRILGRYHKQVLLAFGEYVPFGTLLARIPGLGFLGDRFTPGDRPRALELDGDVRVAPLICYEDLIPHLSRRFVAETGANLLVNLTNDAWYGRSAAPWQHARLSQWRAIETRRSLVRVTNTGVTTVINAKGEMVQSLPIFEPALLLAQVEIMEGGTAYVRFGDWFAWTATLLTLAGFGMKAGRRGAS